MPSCPRPSSSATAMGRRASLPAWVRHAPAWLLLAALALPAAARDAQVAPPPATLETVQVRAERARDPLGDDRSSYAPEVVTLGKLPLSLRAIPQSVSVLTRQQMDDQNLASFDQAMQQVAGVKVQHSATARPATPRAAMACRCNTTACPRASRYRACRNRLRK